MTGYRVVDFTAERALELAPKVRHQDRRECELMGHAVIEALIMGSSMGGCYMIAAPDGSIIGSFGWTKLGTIWGLFADLTFGARKAILKQGPAWVRQLQKEAQNPFLGNACLATNTDALRWLEATDCFVFHPPALSDWVGFATKPIEDHPRYV